MCGTLKQLLAVTHLFVTSHQRDLSQLQFKNPILHIHLTREYKDSGDVNSQDLLPYAETTLQHCVTYHILLFSLSGKKSGEFHYKGCVKSNMLFRERSTKVTLMGIS